MVKLSTDKAKVVVKCLANETDYICSDKFFDKYKEELEKVSIKKGNSCSSCLSMATLKEIITKTPKSVVIDGKEKLLQHYKLIDNYKDFIEEESN